MHEGMITLETSEIISSSTHDSHEHSEFSVPFDDIYRYQESELRSVEIDKSVSTSL